MDEVNYMPQVNYNEIPYEKKWSTGEQVISHSFYNPSSDYSENEETYRGYYTHDLFGLKIEKLCEHKGEGDHHE